MLSAPTLSFGLKKSKSKTSEPQQLSKKPSIPLVHLSSWPLTKRKKTVEKTALAAAPLASAAPHMDDLGQAPMAPPCF